MTTTRCILASLLILAVLGPVRAQDRKPAVWGGDRSAPRAAPVARHPIPVSAHRRHAAPR